jgi:hypothetical protein
MQCSFPHPPLPQNSSKILLYWMVYVNRWWAFWFWIHSGVGGSWQYDNPLFHGRIFLVCLYKDGTFCMLPWRNMMHRFALSQICNHQPVDTMVKHDSGLHQRFLNAFLFFLLWHNWRSSIGRCEKKNSFVYKNGDFCIVPWCNMMHKFALSQNFNYQPFDAVKHESRFALAFY